MDNSISDDNSIKTVAAAAVVAASTATAAVGTPTITKSNDGSQCSIDDDHKIGADDNGKSKTVKATNTTATHIAPNDTDNKSKEYSLRRNDGNYKRITSKCISRARDLVHKCQSDPGGSRVSSTSPSSSSSAAATQSSIAALNSAINRSSQRSLRHQSPGCSSNTASATATTTRKCVLTLDGYNYVIVASSPDSKSKTENFTGATSSEHEQKTPFDEKGQVSESQRSQVSPSASQQPSTPTLNGLISIRRSSTKKSDYFTKRYSQPQIETGHEFTYPTNHQHSQKQNISPAHSPCDVQRGVETVAGNKRKPYLNRRSQLYRFSCDDYHSSNTVAVDSDKCRFEIGAGATACATAFNTTTTTTSTTDTDTATVITAADDQHFDWNKMQSDSVSSSSSAQNRCLTEHDGMEQVAANAVDLATDNLPAVDTPDACDKAALRLRCLLKLLQRGDVSAEILQKNLHYAARVLEALYIDETKFVQKQMGIWKTGYSDDEYVVQPIDPTTIKTMVMNERDREAGSNQNIVALSKSDVDENEERDKLVQFEKPQEESSLAQNYLSNVSAISKTKYCSPFTHFFRKLLKMTNRVSADVYTYIFLCDFINFFVLLFGFTAFGSSQGDGGVTSYLQENKIPIAFLIMLLLQFVFIIVDRALYLRKNLLGKIIFQFVSVVGMHIWLFFLVPIFSERSFNAKLPPIMYYAFKYLYFLLSAYQIRCGYPRRILGNCLTKGFTMFNLFAFKVYMSTPFLFELRTLMDWIWTDTTMPLFEWLKMEDIFANIFELKCSRQMEKDFPAPRGQSKGSFIKYLMGGGFLIAIIGLVWGPLALFALGNTVGEPNNPYEVRVSLRIGPYEPVYSMSAQSSQIDALNEQDYDQFQKAYLKDRSAITFLSNYEANDVAAVKLGPQSTSLWIISPPDLQRLKEDLTKNTTLKVQFKYVVSRVTNTEKIAGTVTGERSFDLKSDTPAYQELLKMLNHTSSDDKRSQLPFLFLKFLKVKNSGDLKPAQQLIPNPNDINDLYYRNLTLILHENGEEKWWEVLEECDDEFYNRTLSQLPYANCKNNSVMYTFSDKLFPSTLSWLTAGGVIGIYTTFVFVASRFFRGLFSGSSFNIMYSELPFVDRILQLCLDIYLVRESLEFALEEDLFAKLIFLYRSPEVMIRWTRPAEEQSSDEDDASDIDETEAEKALRKAPSRSLYKS